MKKRVTMAIVALTMAAMSSVSLAGEPPKDRGPEIINLKMAELQLPFKHWQHQKNTNNECFHCHASKIGKIDGWGKETAHKICIACHELEGKGPASCRQCHTKKKKKK